MLGIECLGFSWLAELGSSGPGFADPAHQFNDERATVQGRPFFCFYDGVSIRSSCLET